MRKNYPREVPSYQLREHRRSLSAMRGGDSDAREEHHDIHTGESVRFGPSRYNNVTPGLARARPGRCTPHRRRANAMRYAIVNPLTLSLPSHPGSPSPNGRHGRDGRDPTPVAAIRPAAFGPPPRERGESERGREGGAATRSQFARVSPPLESSSVSAWMRVIGARRRVALIGRDLVSIRGRELSLSRLSSSER